MTGASVDDGLPRLPRPLWGLWRRTALEVPGAAPDLTTRVFYLQAPRLFADLRVPATRPPLRGALSGLARPGRRALARQVAFAGFAEKRGERLLWHHLFDYQLLAHEREPAAVADEGRIALAGLRMTEWGVHRPYVERWERVDDGAGLFLGLLADRGGGAPQQILVIAGDHFLYARERRLRPSGAAGLGEALDAAGADEAAALLDCEFSYGRRRGGRVPWEVVLSTIPMREGARRFGLNAWRLDPSGALVSGPFGEPGPVRRWRIVDATVPREALAPLLNAR